ncbi:phage antirepressor N-terminal domain-containing protein [Terasakiella pusilla]|uniref:phage antirepressor N-terminal domain-containing protein n=1 Tax=Terasakiella pusilla TaxID=64973 RepID=UPI003AA7F46B
MKDSSTSVVAVPFHGDELFLVEHEGQPYTPMKAIVEGMGLNWSTQSKKLRNNADRWGVVKMTIPSLDAHNEVSCMPVRKLPGWLMTVSPNKLKSDGVREKVVQYQNECDDVLWAYWKEGIAINPRIPLTPDHQRGIQKAVARRAQALPKGLQRLAYSRIYSHLKDRFDVAKYDQIPDEQYTQALAAIETCELDGEWLPAPEDNPARLSIDYPMSRWAEINHGLAFDWKNQVPQGYKGREVWFVRPGRLCGDLTDHGSPTLLLLRELVDAGYNIEACQAEINAMRSTISELDSLQQRVLQIAKCGNAYPLIVQR